MIQRNVNVNDLSRFNFTRDAKDTTRWLEIMGRVTEALLLEKHYKEWCEDDIFKFGWGHQNVR